MRSVKITIRKLLAAILLAAMVISEVPMTAQAYVGAMTKSPEGVNAGRAGGYTFLKNDYMGFYISEQHGSLSTVPSQKGVSDLINIPTTVHSFFKQTSNDGEIWKIDRDHAIYASQSTVTVDTTDPDNPKLKQVLRLPVDNLTVTVTYELVALDQGASEGTTHGFIIGKDGSDRGRTWGVLAYAKLSGWNEQLGYRLVWGTRHNEIGCSVHARTTTPSMCGFSTVYDKTSPYTPTTTFYSTRLGSGMGLVDAADISEIYTDQYSYSNEFVALKGYANAVAEEGDEKELISGISGHLNNYGDYFEYINSNLQVYHEGLAWSQEDYALWGLRGLYNVSTGENIPPDPVILPTESSCLGIVKNGGVLSAQPGANEQALKNKFGTNLIAVFRGKIKQDAAGSDYIFEGGAAQLSSSLTMSWTDGSLRISPGGAVTARNVHLSSPTFKFYQPKDGNDTSLRFDFSSGAKITMTPANNQAILHIDIPGAFCSVENVTVAMDGGLTFGGKLSIQTPILDVASINMTRLGMGWKGSSFATTGVEASGEFNMDKLLGLETGKASASINSFPGEELYQFELELEVYEMFEAKGELELKRITNGALIPNNLNFRVATEVGIPLVPPVVVAELNGLGGGFTGLADTINGDFFGIPPITLSVSAHGNVLKILEGWIEMSVGPGYYGMKLTEAELLGMDIIDNYQYYVSLAGNSVTYQGTKYTGLKLSGGMALDLSITRDMPFIKAGGSINLSAFTGLDNYTNPSKAYLLLGADGKIYGLVQIPKEAWSINKDFVLLSAELAFALGGQTYFSVQNTTVTDAVKEAFGNISGYGGVAYTGSLIGFPFRIYYIFQDKDVGIQVGMIGTELDPFDPNPDSFAVYTPLLNAETGEQAGIMVLNDNVTLLATGRENSISSLSVVKNEASGSGVTITPIGTDEKAYTVVIDGSAPDPEHLAFLLKPQDWGGTDGTMEGFLNTVTVTGSAITGSLPLVPAAYDGDGQITNEASANVIVGEDRLTLKLPDRGTWTISSDVVSGAAIDIACLYASPYASLDGMNLTGEDMTGTVKDMGVGKNYILRTYLGTEKGGTDSLMSQSSVLTDSISEKLSLTGSLVPTGDYYVTTTLLEEIRQDFDGSGTVEEGEIAYVPVDTHEFDTMVQYTNTEQPDEPQDVTLESIGSELMRARWKAPAGGQDMDGYFIRLYREDGGSWTETGANYQLMASELTAGANGAYTLAMAVTAGDEKTRLEAEHTYRIGVTAFRYLEDGEGNPTNAPVESAEVHSTEKYLPKAVYPVLSYDPEPLSGDGMKLLHISGTTQVTVLSDVPAHIAVTRMDTGDVIGEVDGTLLDFDTPNDFAGALNLKVTAEDAQGDITVDYLGLRLDDTPPLITLDSDPFLADHDTGTFTVTGVTESGAQVEAQVRSDGARLTTTEATADANGVFTITGRLNPEDAASGAPAADGALLVLQARDTADNASEAFTQILRAEPPIFTATVDPGSKTFTAAMVGYDNSTMAQVFTITNTGTGVISNLRAFLGGSDFEISSALSGASLAAGDTATVSVRPKAGLLTGTGALLTRYTDTLTVTGDEGVNLTVSLSFTVQAASSVAVTGVSLNPGSLALSAGSSRVLTATVEPANAANKEVIWSSSAPGVASVDSTGRVTAVSAGTATVTVTTGDGGFTAVCVVTVTENGGGSGNNGGSGGYTAPTPSAPPESSLITGKSPDYPTMASRNLTAKVNKNGVATVTISEAQVKALIDAAKKDAKEKGNTEDGIGIAFNIKFGTDGKSVKIKLDKKALALLEKEGVKRFDVNTPLIDFSFDQAAVREMKSQASGAVTIAASPVTKLSKEARKLIGTRPVYDLTVSYQKNGKTAYVSNFKKGTVTLGIPYQPSGKEKAGSLFGVFIDKKGKAQLLTNSGYRDGRLIFERNSLSSYGIGYKTPAPAFTDTVKHWAKDSIDFVVSRDLISGSTAKTFAPDTAITRAAFLMALGKLSGADVSGFKTSSFTDVRSSDSAMPYIEWAVKNQIAQGVGDGRFGPGQPISREQMAVILVKYAAAVDDRLSVSVEAITFTDSTKIAADARDAVTAVQQAGIMKGKGSSFDPQGNVTRGEASVFLHRYVELAIDESTARGWSLDDAGQWQYVDENGIKK